VVEVKAGDYREIKAKVEFERYLEGLGEGAALALSQLPPSSPTTWRKRKSQSLPQSGFLALQPAHATEQER
jgi:predicted transcriptional regulator